MKISLNITQNSQILFAGKPGLITQGFSLWKLSLKQTFQRERKEKEEKNLKKIKIKKIFGKS